MKTLHANNEPISQQKTIEFIINIIKDTPNNLVVGTIVLVIGAFGIYYSARSMGLL